MYTVVAQAPGRINIIGEHTDYNQGLVLPAAIDKKSIFRLKKNGTPASAKIYSIDMEEEYSFDLDNIKPISDGWENYVLGVVAELQKMGGQLQGFDGEFEADVPIGGGMSSSAALECSLAYGLNALFDLGFDKWQLIKASQMAEHNYVGIKCGIMDQFASMMGKANQVMLLDCASLEFEYFPLDLQDYQFLLINSNVSHSLASSEYNKRREECLAGLSILQHKYPEYQSLSDVSMDVLLRFSDDMSPVVFNRCRHVISENQRVKTATQSLQDNNFEQLGELLYASHHSLRDDYEVSCDELDFLVAQTYDKEYVLGSRMMGGGFGGCTLNLIKKSSVEEFTNLVTQKYFEHTGLKAIPYSVSVENGAALVIPS